MSDILIGDLVIANTHGYSATAGAIKLRIWYTGCAGTNFQDSLNNIVMCGNGANSFYLEVPVVLIGTDLHIPAYTLPSTDDASQLTVLAQAQFYVNNAARAFLFQNWIITNTLGASVAFDAMFDYNIIARTAPGSSQAQFLAAITALVLSLISDATQSAHSEEPTGLINGVNTVFTLSQIPVAGSLLQFANKQLQEEGVDYTLAGNVITFAVAPSPGDWLFSVYTTTSGILGNVDFASDTEYGITRLTEQPFSPTDPMAVADNDGRLVYASSSDPAVDRPNSVAAGAVWLDTSAGFNNLAIKIRNSTNTAWVATGSALPPFNSQNVPGLSLNLDMSSFDPLSTSGTPVPLWPDTSGNGNNATPINALVPVYAVDVLDGLPYLATGFSGLVGGYTAPIPATATKTVFMVVRHFPTLPLLDSAPLRFNVNSQIIASHSSFVYVGYQTDGATSTAGFGFSEDWAVLCWRQNGLDVELYFNGVLAVPAFTLFAASATATLLMREVSTFRQVVMFPSALTAAQVKFYSDWLQQVNTNNYQQTYVPDSAGSVVAGNQTLYIKKKNLLGLRPTVIFTHAVGETERQFRDDLSFRRIVDGCIEAGYLVILPRARGDAWGNNNSLTDIQNAYDYAVLNLSADPANVAIVGDSMGGIPALLSAPLTTIPVKGIGLYYPVCDVAFQRTFNAAMGTSIDAAYPPNFPTSGAGHDPIDRVASDWAGIRFIWFGSTLDTVVPYTNHTAAMRTLVDSVATENTFTDLNGNHNTSIDTTQNALLAFLARCF